jgi:phosphorylase kinase alpha/beta subunit
MGPVFHNRELERLHASDGYTRAQVDAVAAALEAHGTLRMTPLPTGLYPATSAADAASSGYRHVWVRDNVYVALALWRSGQPEPAAAVARGLLAFYRKHRHRLDVAVVAAGFDARDVMSRPHARFDGVTLDELPGRSAHAQNDAVGYALWLAATLAARRVFTPTEDEVATLQALVGYLEAVRFWDDEDSGHWEETRKIGASSIGTVDAGLRAWRELLRAAQGRDLRLAGVTVPEARELEITATALIDEAGRALLAILPSECTQPPPRERRYDAALLFLVHPLGVVHGTLADRIVEDVREHLQGAVGIRRYLGDSYWAPDYERRVAADERTRDSTDIETRDRLLEGAGREAQWCLFDPMLSALFGERVKAGGGDVDRARQVAHFNRALAQVTDTWMCPELYYERDGALAANPHTPLLWAQANLRLALTLLHETTA